jgi:hypothetical protein
MKCHLRPCCSDGRVLLSRLRPQRSAVGPSTISHCARVHPERTNRITKHVIEERHNSATSVEGQSGGFKHLTQCDNAFVSPRVQLHV